MNGFRGTGVYCHSFNEKLLARIDKYEIFVKLFCYLQ